MLISGFGMVDDISKCLTMDAKASGNVLVLVGETKPHMGGSHVLLIDKNAKCNTQLPTVSLIDGPRNAILVHEVIQAGLVTSAHDCSEGGVLLAAAEMAFGGELGLELQLQDESLCFSETPSRYVLEVRPEHVEKLQQHLHVAACEVIGTFNDSGIVSLGNASWKTEDLCHCWMHGMVL